MPKSCYICGRVYQNGYIKKYQTRIGEIYICPECKKAINEEKISPKEVKRDASSTMPKMR